MSRQKPVWRFSSQVQQQLFGDKGRSDEEEEVDDRDYVDYVRQFRRSELVALVAATAPAVAFNQADYKVNNTLTPWGLADVARVSLAFGSERNRLSPPGSTCTSACSGTTASATAGLRSRSPTRWPTCSCSWRSRSSRTSGVSVR